MILAPTLTLNALRGPSVDPDVAAYVATSGATDVAAVSAFVKGVKDLGLWNNMVCWPLRSTQNAGTGTTAYSLGGLGTFNGTLVNGPTWGSDGAVFDAGNKHISLPNNAFGVGNAPTTLWTVYKNDADGNRMFVLRSGSLTSTDSMFIESPQFFNQRRIGIAFTNGPTLGFNTTNFVSTLIGNTDRGFGGFNGGTVTDFTLNNTLNKSGTVNLIGSSNESIIGKVSIVLSIATTPSTQINADLHTLYKQTLGTGLGLP
jgi:hypothetical protein